MQKPPRSRRTRPGDGQKAIGIVRVSTSKQDIGAAAQRRELTNWADREGVELLAIFEDLGVSGAAPLAERPGLMAAIIALKSRGGGKLVAAKRDRFARHRHAIADIERAVANAGAVLVTTDGVCKGEDTEAEELTNSFQDILAQMELRKIRARNQARAQQCIAEGRTHGGRLPYGCRRKKSGTRGRSGVVVELELDPREQRTIRRMSELVSSGQSLRAVAAALAADGVRTRDGKAWQAMAIKRILDRAARPGAS